MSKQDFELVNKMCEDIVSKWTKVQSDPDFYGHKMARSPQYIQAEAIYNMTLAQATILASFADVKERICALESSVAALRGSATCNTDSAAKSTTSWAGVVASTSSAAK
jgi:hypothetical protein